VTFEPIKGTLVIGIGHKARHGKDTAARILIDTFKDVRRFSFADDLYAVCRVMHGMTSKDPALLQRVGMEIRDQRGENALANATYAKLVTERPRVAVITDVRFPNEFACVKALGGVCWKVERRTADGSVVVDPSRSATHPSETALDDAPWDRVIVNPDGNIEAFADAVRSHYLTLTTGAVEAEYAGPGAFVRPSYARMGAVQY
jgi:hypothetical protein